MKGKMLNLVLMFAVVVFMFDYCAAQNIIQITYPGTFDKVKNSCTEPKPTIKSPVDIEYYNSKGHMVFPGNPKIVLDRTFYRRVNSKKLDFIKKDITPSDIYHELEMNITGIGTAYVKVYNITYEYKPYALRLHVYSEHTFEGTKMDMEIQIMHNIATPVQSPSIVPSKIGLAVLFSVARNKHSSFVEEFIETLDEETEEAYKYEFGQTKSLDLNQFFNFWEPFYHYKGSGTSPQEYCNEVDWFVMKKVQNMSQDQLKKILLILANKGYPNGNAKDVETDQEPSVNYCPNVEPDEDE